ncbi:hypothetical protein KIPB_002885 [Kipferlia bialata]|uniref:Kelch-type beta propeller n=1 Tax=Kipferlia bialata TaxID=797122 RepID=A0A391NUN1_9EUKA|nr:hypothetical protein KIPB_002885 [Kipferlia bialata]|eukprot:g2885.t1
MFDLLPDWVILSVCGHSITTESIKGPSNPDYVYGMQLHRVGDTVVAYGGVAILSECDPWFMAVYCIATGEWETYPYPEGPPALSSTTAFSMGDTLVVTGYPYEEKEEGEEEGEREGEAKRETWEWSVCTREWTQIPSLEGGQGGFNAVGSTGGYSFMFFHRLSRICYSRGMWEKEDPIWDPCPLDVHGNTLYHSIGVPLGRNEIQLVSPADDGATYTVWLLDPVSLDLVPLQPLPLPDRDEHFTSACAVMVSPTTMLFLRSDVSLVVEIDPHFLSPVYHTSMVGCVFSARTVS